MFVFTASTDDFPISDEAKRAYAAVMRSALAAQGRCFKCGGPHDLAGPPEGVPCARCDYPDENAAR